MNKLIRLSPSGIEYLDYAWGVFSGCENWANGICLVPNCWAKSIAYRFPGHYPDGFTPHYYPEAINSPKHINKPSRIGVGWVGDVIGYGLAYKEQIFETIEQCPQHIFLFLTKNPDRLISWGNFPDNCWVGVTTCNELMFQEAAEFLLSVKASIKYISFEPLLEWANKDFLYSTEQLFKAASISWLIIGAQTKPYKPPRIEWVREIVEAADKAGIPVFLKDNLRPLLVDALAKKLIDKPEFFVEGEGYGWDLRQEMPND